MGMNAQSALMWEQWIVRGANYRWMYCDRNADFWFERAKRHKSASHFRIASWLSAMDMWDIIGNVRNTQDGNVGIMDTKLLNEKHPRI
jgi:hypothetical protein